MSVLRTAVIGVGYLGRFHAQKYAQAAASRLVAVVDANEGARTRVAAMGRHLVTADRAGLQVVDASPWSARSHAAAPAP